jgi:hypothetical protein
MFKNKKANFELKKENVVINMVLVVTTKSQVFEANAFKEKEKSFEDVIEKLQKEEPPLQLPTPKNAEELPARLNKHQETKDAILMNLGSKIKTNVSRVTKE